MCQIRPLHMGTLESLVKLVKWGVIDVISSSVGSQFIGMVAILYGFLVCVCVCVCLAEVMFYKLQTELLINY